MAIKRKIILVILSFILLMWLPDPIGIGRISLAIDVDDGTLADWVNATVNLTDPLGDTPNDMTDFVFVSFDFDDTWFYVRWDIDNDTYSPAVLYDMGLNTTASGTTWDIYVSAQIELIGGIPELTNISIRDASDVHIWNASDDGNMIEDGSLYLDPAPGIPPGNHSTEARYPLAYLGIPAGVVFGQFRSHASTSVNSAVKDWVPDSGYIVLSIDKNPPELANLTDTPDPQLIGDYVNITVDVTDDFKVNDVRVNITYPNGSWVNVSMTQGIGDEWFLNTSYDSPGAYIYTVWANDSSNNWNSTGPGAFTILDIGPPELSNLDDFPDPQENGGFVNITVNVTDDVAVDKVWINITYPNGSWVNVSMQPAGSDGWYYNNTYDDLDVYSYKVWANDTANKWNSTGPGTFTIKDTDPPGFFNLTDTPDPQEYGGFVNITVNVTDDVAVDEVWINITYPDNTWVNTSMTPSIGDEWFFNITYENLTLYSYVIWANDTNDNWNSSGPGTFTIQDTGPPEFSNINDVPDPQEAGGFVNITVVVIDDVAVDGVWIYITYPDSSSINLSMIPGGGNEWYYHTNYSDIGTYSYMIWMNDTSDNWNSTSQETFSIQAVVIPQIIKIDDTPDPQENGGYVNITAEVIDNVGVGEVWVNITYPNGSCVNTSMDHGIGDEWFFNTTYDDLNLYSYSIWAKDTGNNWNSTGPGTFTIQDTDPPSLTNLDDLPDPQENSGFVNITVDVVDDVDVDEVWVNITYPDGSWINTRMVRGIDDEWFFNDVYDLIGGYSYEVWANDTSNNMDIIGPGTFTIEDTDPPELTNANETPDPQENGGSVNITVEVTDDVALDEVWINITYPDGSWINTTMNRGTDDEWYLEETYTNLGNYYYIVWAMDTSDNWNNTALNSFIVQDTDRPEIGQPDATPGQQEEGGEINITVDVTDDVGTSEVWVNITFPDGTWQNVSMTQGVGSEWFYSDTFDETGDYGYTIWAVDSSGNWNNTDPESFSFVPVQPPEEPPEEPSDLFRMMLRLIFWPILLILFTIALVRRYAFSTRFWKDIEPTSRALLHHSGPGDLNSLYTNPKLMEELITLALRTGIPVEEFVLAMLAAWSESQIGGSFPHGMKDYLINLKNSLETGNWNEIKYE